MTNDDNEFGTSEEVAASGTSPNSTSEGTDASQLDWHELFPTTPITTRPATLNNNNDKTSSPHAIDDATNPQHYLHRTDGNLLK
jgi:hypothetical protein